MISVSSCDDNEMVFYHKDDYRRSILEHLGEKSMVQPWLTMVKMVEPCFLTMVDDHG